MKSILDTSILDNPYIQVIWEDSPENFTQERIRSVKHYFQKKYRSNNINVVTKVKSTDQDLQSIDVSLNIMDKNYQIELVKKILDSKNLIQYFEQIMGIDSIVDNRMVSNEVEVTPFKKWYIKKIEFSNFLSYGEKQVIDFEKCNGIVVVESDPPNFGGKTILTVDLLLFLFFNTTTKTQKSEEIFNRYTDKNQVSVRGEILIDGEEYIIARKIERKKNKSGEWSIKNELDFFKKLSDGSLQNFTGEQRRETESFIKNSIGEMDDFLMTILTTASNLEDLIDSKPTARGQILSRFLGLEFLKKKEESAKEIYSEFSKTMLSNLYNTEELKHDIENYEKEIQKLKEVIKVAEKQIEDVDKRLQKGQDYKDSLLNSKYTDLDEELITLNPENLNREINLLKSTIDDTLKNIQIINIIEPKEYYHEDKHDLVKDDILKSKIELGKFETKLEEIKSLVEKFGNGVQCEHCGIKLMDAEITKKKISESDGLKSEMEKLIQQIGDLEIQEKSFVELKNAFDKYEKDKLIKEKFEISLENSQNKKSQLESKLERYEKVQEKIKKNNEIDSQIIKAGMRITELISEKRNYEKIKTSNQINIDNFSLSIDSKKDIIIKIAEEFEREKLFKIYLDLFGKNGISKIIMKTMMPVINSELQRLLQDSCYFNLEIRISEKNEVEFIMIENSTGDERLMNSGSGYERTIASLALRAVLAKVSSLPKPNFIALDEPFGKISNDNLDLVGQFFDKIKSYFEKIFVISHNPLISNWADTYVRVSKRENISKVSQ